MLLSLATSVGAVAVEEERGDLVGWVADTRGRPVSGAVISLFARGVPGGGFVTLSDSAGRFVLSALPAGSYTLRAQGRDHQAAPAQQITVKANEDSIFSVSLVPLGPLSAAESKARSRELEWLLRHRRRSILESQALAAGPASGSGLSLQSLQPPPWDRLGGTVEVVANPAALGVGPDLPASENVPSAFSVVRLGGRFADDHVRWSLGGLVAESSTTAWRMAAEFAVEPEAGREIRFGAGYGSRMLRPVVGKGSAQNEDHGLGALFLDNRWEMGNAAVSLGGRYSYVGYVRRANYLDPRLELEWRGGDGTVLRARAVRRTLMPGGDLLALSSLATAPALAFAVMDPDVRPERIGRYELAVDRPLGSSTLTAFTFVEAVRDPMVNEFSGPRSSLSLRIANAPDMAARGLGVGVSRSVGRVLRGSVSYSHGRAWRGRGRLLAPLSPEGWVAAAPPAGREADGAGFHDVVMRLETAIDRSDTRLVAFYRWSALRHEDERSTHTTTRFDLQLRQGLPVMSQVTGADWELLLAFRNLFYEPTEAASLDEIAVSRPPRRILAGLSIRF